MSIAPVSCESIALTERVADIELEITSIDLRRQHLNLGLTRIQSDYQTEFAKFNLEDSLETDSDDESNTLELDWEQFKLEYSIAEEQIQTQDKRLEMERTALQNEKEMLSTALESIDKRLSKNIESEMKGANA